MQRTSTSQRGGRLEQTLVALLSAAFVFYPVPGLGQQSGESSSGEAEAESESGDASGSAGNGTPAVFLLPTRSVRDQISEIVPDRVGDMLRSQLDSEASINLSRTMRKLTASPGGAGEVSAAIKEAREQYTSGIGLVEAGNYEEAADQFSEAVETFRENIAELDNFDVYTDALANLARSYWEIGHDYDARSAIREFAHMRPEADLDPKKYAQGLRDLYDEAAQRVAKAGAGKLVVEADVEGAEIFVDGEKKGETPATLEDVKFGYHYMVVRTGDGRAWSKKLQVRGRGNEQTIDPELGTADEEGDAQDQAADSEELPAFYTELLASIREGRFGTDLQPYLQELSDQTGAKFVAWVAMIKEENEYVAVPFVYRVSDQTLVRADQVGFNFQLSNLTVGVNKLRSRIVEAIGEMPEKKVVTSVALVDDEKQAGDGDEEAVASAETSSEEETDDGATAATSEDSESVEAPPEPKPSNQSSTWKYVGITGAILAVGGLAAGGAYLLAGPDGGTQPSGFTANVEW